jgi:hypothetical protein
MFTLELEDIINILLPLYLQSNLVEVSKPFFIDFVLILHMFQLDLYDFQRFFYEFF